MRQAASVVMPGRCTIGSGGGSGLEGGVSADRLLRVAPDSPPGDGTEPTMLRDLIFVSTLLVGASVIGLPFAAALPRTIANRLLLAPALGLAAYAIAVTALYVWGVPTAIGGIIALLAGTIGAAATARRWAGDLRPGSAALTIGAITILLGATLVPAWIGGPAFTSFQGNPYDMLNYEGMAYSYGAHTFAEISGMILGDDLSKLGSFIVDAHIELSVRPAVAIVLSSLYRLFYSNTLSAAYPYMAALSALAWYPIAFMILECFEASLLLAGVVAACLVIGFFGQLVMDINAWGELAGIPVAVATFALFVRITSDRSPSLSWAASLFPAAPTAVLVAGLLYLYPEITPVYAMAIIGAAIVSLIMVRSLLSVGRLAVMALGAAGGLALCLPFLTGTVGSLLKQTSQTASPIGWALFYSGYIFVVPFARAISTLTVGELLADVAYVGDGLAGAYFLMPAAPLTLAGLVRSALDVAGVAAVIACAVAAAWAARRRLSALQAIVGSAFAVAVAAILYVTGRPWEAGKALTMAYPVWLTLLTLPVVVFRRPAALALPACALLALQVAFSADRVAVSARRDGVGRAAPYPTMASVKRSYLIDPVAWEGHLAGCRSVATDISDNVLDRMTQLFLAQRPAPWSDRNGLISPFGARNPYGDMPPIADADCLMTDKPNVVTAKRTLGLRRPPGATGSMIYAGHPVELVASDGEDVDASGFYGPEAFPGGFARWTDGAGHVYVTVPPSSYPGDLTISLATVSPAGDITLRLNGQTLYSGPQWAGPKAMPIPSGFPAGPWTFDILSGSWKAPGDPRSLGVDVTALRLGVKALP